MAVIIILAVIALIATPIVLNVVDSAKAKANEASIQGYGDALKLAVYEKQFENQGKIPSVDKDWALTNVKQGGNEVVCSEVYYSENYGPVLHECKVDGSDDTYYLGNKKIYTDQWLAEITEDGWGVGVADLNSSEPIIGKICSSIDGKPVVSMTYMFTNSLAPSVDFSDVGTS